LQQELPVMRARSDLSLFAQSGEPLNHIPKLLLSLSASRNPTTRNPAPTLWDLGRGSTVNQTHTNPLMLTAPSVTHNRFAGTDPSYLSFCIKATFCWPQLGCKRIPTEARSAIRSLLPLIHLRLGPLRVLISPQHHLACKLHQEITQPLSKMLAQRKEINNQLSNSSTPERNFLIKSPTASTFRPLRAWLPAQAFPCTVTGCMSPKS
jgi:hypothetical protein